ncbi:MAG TPA: diguanylate cyclase, partial [Arenimonas sp.]|nr:diguanylate cyclase [Arenimonas sp.]
PTAGPERALQIGERLREQVAALHIDFAGRALRATISVGAASLPAAEASIERLYREADAALYRAKQQGRNRVELAVVVPAAAVPA